MKIWLVYLVRRFLAACFVLHINSNTQIAVSDPVILVMYKNKLYYFVRFCFGFAFSVTVITSALNAGHRGWSPRRWTICSHSRVKFCFHMFTHNSLLVPVFSLFLEWGTSEHFSPWFKAYLCWCYILPKTLVSSFRLKGQKYNRILRSLNEFVILEKLCHLDKPKERLGRSIVVEHIVLIWDWWKMLWRQKWTKMFGNSPGILFYCFFYNYFQFGTFYSGTLI